MTGVRLVGVRYACEGIRLFELAALAGGTLPIVAPGSSLRLRLPNEVVRPYFIAQRTRRGTYIIGVRRDPDGSTSKYLHDKVRVGAALQIESLQEGPFQAEGPRRAFIVAEDVGVFYAWSLIRAFDARGVDWHLWYDTWSRSDAALLAELAAFGSRITLRVRADDRGRPFAWDPIVCAIDERTRLYACGAPEMEPAIADAARRNGRDISGSTAFTHTVMPRAPGPIEFEVELAKSGVTLPVHAGETILEAILAAGIHARHFCRGGICGTCRTRVLAGVPDHRDAVLSKSERTAGDVMMICQSRTAGKRLVLDL